MRNQTSNPPFLFRPFRLFFFLFTLLTPTAHAILAGGEFGLPADSPSNRLDTIGINSTFNFG